MNLKLFPMKKICLLFLASVFIVTSCTTKKEAGYVLLGDGTPYFQYPENLNGKVKEVTEKNYWAVPDGESYKKGAVLTSADRDSLGGWTSDYRASFNEKGELVSCDYLNEKNLTNYRYEISASGDVVRGSSYKKDSLNYYDIYKLDINGRRAGFIRYRPSVDTMLGKLEVITNPEGDTLKYYSLNSKGEILYTLIVLFNADKQFVRSEGFNKDGVFQYANEVKYNEKGRVSDLSIINKNKDVSASNYFTYEYDQAGNWTKAIVKDDKGIVVVEERSYSYYE